MAAKVEAELGCSGRAACRYLGFNRSTLRYQPKAMPEKKRLLEIEIVRMSKKHPTLGYKKVAKLLRDEGWHVNKKLVQRKDCRCHRASPGGVARASPRGSRSRHDTRTMSGPGIS